MITSQDLPAARKLVRSKAMAKAGMVYLEHEAATYTAKSGKTYTIYGSPVGGSRCRISPVDSHSSYLGRTILLRRSIPI